MATNPIWSEVINTLGERRDVNFKSGNHAFTTGMFLAFLREKWGYADIVLDEHGDYTPRIVVRGAPFGKVTIEVLPPEDGQ